MASSFIVVQRRIFDRDCGIECWWFFVLFLEVELVEKAMKNRYI